MILLNCYKKIHKNLSFSTSRGVFMSEIPNDLEAVNNLPKPIPESFTDKHELETAVTLANEKIRYLASSTDPQKMKWKKELETALKNLREELNPATSLESPDEMVNSLYRKLERIARREAKESLQKGDKQAEKLKQDLSREDANVTARLAEAEKNRITNLPDSSHIFSS